MMDFDLRKLFTIAILTSAVVVAQARRPVCTAAETNNAVQSSAATVSYYRDVLPIFQAHCHGCHQPAKASGGYTMTNFDELSRGGDSEVAAIKSGTPDESQLVELITPVDGVAEMPRERSPLADSEIRTIRMWIEQGAKDDSPSATKTKFDADHPPRYPQPPIITSIDFSPDGSLLAISGYHEVLVFSGDGENLVARLIGLSERIQSAVFSPNGKKLAVVGGSPARSGEVQIWDLASRELQLSVPVLHDTIYGASWSPDGKYIAFGCPDNSVRAVDAETGEQVLLQRAPNDWTLATVFSVDGSHVISVGRDMAVKLIEFKTQRFVDNITSISPGALRGGILAIDRHPKRDEVLIGGDDGVPRTYRAFRQVARVVGDDSNLIRRFPALPGRVFSVAFSPDGDRIACGTSNGDHGRVVVYSAKYDSSIPKEIAEIESIQSNNRTPEQLAKLEKHYTSDVSLIAEMKGQEGPVYAVAYRPDGALLASAGFDGCIRFNNPDTGELIATIKPFSSEQVVGPNASISQVVK